VRGIETLKRWVAEGAEYEPHWPLVRPVRPAVPDHQDEFALGPLDESMRVVCRLTDVQGRVVREILAKLVPDVVLSA
jgi:hypothetical protein